MRDYIVEIKPNLYFIPNAIFVGAAEKMELNDSQSGAPPYQTRLEGCTSPVESPPAREGTTTDCVARRC